MNIKKIAKAAVTLLCTAALCFFSCKKKEKGTFYIKGQLMDSCNGNPIAGKKLIVSFLYKGSWVTASKSIDSAGGAITDANGNFYIACNDEGSGNYRIVSEQKRTYASLGLDKGNGEIADIGTVYLKYNTYVIVKFTFANANPNDTLYFGSSIAHPTKLFNPIPASKVTYYSSIQENENNNELPYPKGYVCYWGMGLLNYQHAVKNQSNRIDVKQRVCIVDTTFVNIP